MNDLLKHVNRPKRRSNMQICSGQKRYKTIHKTMHKMHDRVELRRQY